MQDNGKRLFLVAALIMGVMLMWNMVFKPKDADQPPPQPTAAPTAQVVQHSQVGEQPSAGPTTTPTTPRGAEQTLALTFPNVVATFSSYGGTLTSWQLTDPRYAHDATKGQLLPDPKTMPETGAFGVNFDRGSSYVLPAKAEWHGEKVSDTEVRYTLSTPELDITKTFDIVPDAFLVKLTVKVAAKTDRDAHEHLAVTSYEFQDPKKATTGSARIQPRQWDSATQKADDEKVSTPIASILEGGPRFEPAIKWTGFEHPYLLVAFAPNPSNGIVAKHTYAEANGLMRTDLIFGDAPLAKGVQPLTAVIVGYLGPKNYDQLEHADRNAGFPTGFSSVIDFGWFGFIGHPLLWLLLKFHEVVGNWGLAIVLLTLLVKGATLFWTTKSMRSMKAMAVLGPQMKALQEKYKEDKQRLQMETMALYKQHGVNPLAGCLPILLQMPIWIALYRMLSNAGELYQQPFIHGWIDDLTGSDPYYVLPIILVVTMFAQARLTPTTVDPSQRMQQRMMQYGMPLMFGVMSFFFPAGLTLYIFTNTCLSALHSIYMNKFDKKSIALAAQLKKNQADKAAAKAKDENLPRAVANAKDANVREREEREDRVKPDAEIEKPRVRTSQRRKKGGRR